MFLFYLEIVNKMRQVPITISASSNHAGGVDEVYTTVNSPQLSNFVKVKLKNPENCSPGMQIVKITLSEALRQLKRSFINFLLLFAR